MAKLKPNARGMVPVVMLVSEAGLGLRKGEVRGVSPEVAERMIAKKSAALHTPGAQAAAEKEAAREAEDSEKELEGSKIPGFSS